MDEHTCWCCGEYLKPKHLGLTLGFEPCACNWTDRCTTKGQCKNHCRCGACKVVTADEWIATRHQRVAPRPAAP